MALAKIEIGKPYISQAICIVGYPVNKKIRYTQMEAEDCFRSLFEAQSTQTNVPDDFDPNAPRLVFQSHPRQLLLSQVAAQFKQNFESAEDKSLSEQLEIITDNINEFKERIARFGPAANQTECALILNINLPVTNKNRRELSEYLHRHFFSFSMEGDTAAAMFKVGYLLPEKIFFNLMTDIYEIRKVQFQSENGAPTTIDLNSLPVAEHGFLLQIDANNRPKSSESTFQLDDMEVLIKKANDFLSGDISRFIGFEV